MGYLSNQTKNILKDAFKRQVKLNDNTIKADDFQIIIGLKKIDYGDVEIPIGTPTHLPVYSLSKKYDYNNREFLEFENLTGKGIEGNWDMIPYKDLCAEHLPKFIVRLAKEKKLDPEKTEIFVLSNNEKVDRLGLCIYHNKQLVKPIDFDYLFGDDDDTIKTKEQFEEWFNMFIHKKVTV